MIITQNIYETRTYRWAGNAFNWGFVPTMGYLHEGHLSLVRQAKEENDRVAVSIFVNPTQFAPHEDLSTYPRDLDRDLELLRAEKVHLVFIPDVASMYPPDFQTKVTVSDVTKPLEGAARPTHFDGVTTIVTKLFNIIQPTAAYFGQKDAQQTAVLRQMVQDLNFSLELVICPTVREADGLAMSSRNAYLTPTQRQEAPILYQALSQAHQAYQEGERNADTLRQLMTNLIQTQPSARIDYVSVAHPDTLAELSVIENGVLFSTAVYFSQTRLIDNISVPVD